jgi:transposase-like protein
VRAIGVTEVTYYRWRREFGGLKSDQVKRLKDLEAENARLRRAISDLTLDKQILAEAARGNYYETCARVGGLHARVGCVVPIGRGSLRVALCFARSFPAALRCAA